MTEAEWLASDDPVRLLGHLDRWLGDRKLLLYAVACCRAHWELLIHRHSREAVEWAEKFADGLVQRDEAYSRLEWESEGAAFACEATAEANRRLAQYENTDVVEPDRFKRPAEDEQRIIDAAYLANGLMTMDVSDPYDPTLASFGTLLSTPLVRDICGNPFRPLAFDPAWRTDTAVSLARGMYESRDFGAMPILADALQDAGCDSDDILTHCRDETQVHVRGCWVVDLVLGKA